MLEKLIAQHCAPALFGIKPSNIVACQKADVKNIHEKIDDLNKSLNHNDIFIDILCECDRRVLIMVYKKSVLKSHLSNYSNRVFLNKYGYSTDADIKQCLDILKTRLSCNSFPHEIGVFLGYPLYDIQSFINHRDEGCLLIGEWRVYHNVEKAQKTFKKFKACNKFLKEKVMSGEKLAEIFNAA